MACLPLVVIQDEYIPWLISSNYLVLFLHPAKRKTAFVRVNIEIQLLFTNSELKVELYEWRTLVSNLQRDKSTCSFAQSHFLIYSSGGFILYSSTVTSWGRREKSHNPDQDWLGQLSALLAMQWGCETDCSLFPRHTQLALPCVLSSQLWSVLGDFFHTYNSSFTVLWMFPSQELVTKMGTQTNQTAQNNPQNSQQLLKALCTLSHDHRGFLPFLCADLRRLKGGAK